MTIIKESFKKAIRPAVQAIGPKAVLSLLAEVVRESVQADVPSATTAQMVEFREIAEKTAAAIEACRDSI